MWWGCGCLGAMRPCWRLSAAARKRFRSEEEEEEEERLHKWRGDGSDRGRGCGWERGMGRGEVARLWLTLARAPLPVSGKLASRKWTARSTVCAATAGVERRGEESSPPHLLSTNGSELPSPPPSTPLAPSRVQTVPNEPAWLEGPEGLRLFECQSNRPPAVSITLRFFFLLTRLRCSLLPPHQFINLSNPLVLTRTHPNQSQRRSVDPPPSHTASPLQ